MLTSIAKTFKLHFRQYTNFAHEYDIQFNTAKCQLIKYGESGDVPFYFNGTLIEYMYDMVFILVIQLAGLPIVIW